MSMRQISKKDGNAAAPERDPQQLLDVKFVANFFRCSIATVRKRVRNGEIECTRVGIRQWFSHRQIHDSIRRRIDVWNRRPKKPTAAQRRYTALTRPITIQQICEFSSRLVRVDYGSGECWLYLFGASVGGASRNYARIKLNGIWVGAHRFALAVKLGCTMWALSDYDCSHLPLRCVGSKCCNPAHLTKKKAEPNRSWDRAKVAAAFGCKATRTEKELRAMIAAMYPTGMLSDGSFFDRPWEQHISPQLRRFLEIGLKNDLQKMHSDRINAAQVAR